MFRRPSSTSSTQADAARCSSAHEVASGSPDTLATIWMGWNGKALVRCQGTVSNNGFAYCTAFLRNQEGFPDVLFFGDRGCLGKASFMINLDVKHIFHGQFYLNCVHDSSCFSGLEPLLDGRSIKMRTN